eukprot:1424030-Amphidinium_carterae.1
MAKYSCRVESCNMNHTGLLVMTYLRCVSRNVGAWSKGECQSLDKLHLDDVLLLQGWQTSAQ